MKIFVRILIILILLLSIPSDGFAKAEKPTKINKNVTVKNSEASQKRPKKRIMHNLGAKIYRRATRGFYDMVWDISEIRYSYYQYEYDKFTYKYFLTKAVKLGEYNSDGQYEEAETKDKDGNLIFSDFLNYYCGMYKVSSVRGVDSDGPVLYWLKKRPKTNDIIQYSNYMMVQIVKEEIISTYKRESEDEFRQYDSDGNEMAVFKKVENGWDECDLKGNVRTKHRLEEDCEVPLERNRTRKCSPEDLPFVPKYIYSTKL